MCVDTLKGAALRRLTEFGGLPCQGPVGFCGACAFRVGGRFCLVGVRTFDELEKCAFRRLPAQVQELLSLSPTF